MLYIRLKIKRALPFSHHIFTSLAASQEATIYKELLYIYRYRNNLFYIDVCFLVYKYAFICKYDTLPPWHLYISRMLASPMACRPWRYNDEIPEYYVITDDTTSVKQAEKTTHHEETALDATWCKPHPMTSQP